MTPRSARDSAVRFLSSTKLAVALCLVLAAGGVAGSLLYQGNTAFDKPSMFNVFRSPLFLAPAGLLVLNVLVCAGTRLSAMRAGASRTWTFAGIHAGLVLLVAGMVADGLSGFVGTGYFFAGKPSGAYHDWRANRDATFPFLLDVRDIRVEYHPINLRIGVADPGGKKLGPYTVREGIPFRAGNSGIAVIPRRFDVNTKTLLFDARVGGTTFTGLRAGMDGSTPLDGYVVVPVAYQDPEPSGYVASVRFLRPGAPPEEKVIRINRPARYAGMSFCIVTQGRDRYGNPYVGFQMTREPGEGLFWTGGILFGLSAVGHFLARSLARRGKPVAESGEVRAAEPAATGWTGVAGLLIGAAVFLGAVPGPAQAFGVVIDRDTTWEGKVPVTEPVTVEKGATLRIRPGTLVLLSGEDRDGDGCRDGSLLVFGTLLVEGEKERPVRFRPLRAGRRWGEIFLGDAKAAVRYAVFEGATWGLHVHEGDVTVEQSLFRDNDGGARTRGRGAKFSRCTFRENGIGLRFWDGGPVVTESVFEGNRTGIFYRDGKGGGRITACRLASREWDLKVGDWATGDLDAAGNFWRATGDGGAPRLFKDYRESRSGLVTVTPSLSSPPAPCGADFPEGP